MSELDIDAIEKRAAKAIPGPWDYDTCDGISQHWSCEKPWLDVLVMEGSDSWGGCNHRISVSEADAEFIAEARTDIPALIQRVRELEAAGDESANEVEGLAPLALEVSNQHVLSLSSALAHWRSIRGES